MAKKNQRKFSNFRNKVLGVMLFTGTIPLIIVSLISLWTVLRTRLENISEFQTQVISGTEEKIIRFLEKKTSVFNLVIDLDPQDLKEIKPENLDFFATGLKEAAGDVSEIRFVDKKGKEIIKKSEATGNPGDLADASETEAFKTAISGKNYFGPVSYELSGPVMDIASQVENKNREIIGVIIAKVRLDPLQKEIETIKLGIEGFVYIADQDGKLLLSSNNNFGWQGKDIAENSLLKDVLSGNLHNGLKKEDKYQNTLGQIVIFSGRKMDFIQWAVLSEWPVNDAFAVAKIMARQSVFVIFITLTMILTLSLVFARVIMKPLETLSRGAEEISKGNLEYKIDIRTGDEFEKLGERFNNMLAVLRENQRLRDEFVFIATHELRSPVTVFKHYIYLLLKGDFGIISKEINDALSTMQEVNERLVKLVDDLLEVARSESGKMEVELQAVSIKSAVKKVLNSFANSTKEKGINIVYNEPLERTEVMADSDKLEEVLVNLIDNALKYIVGKGYIEISHERKGEFLITRIEDSGIGISKLDQEKLFSRFFRVRSKETRDVAGTGLGLFICKKLVERMGGAVWVESELGEGSTFSFSLYVVE